MKQNNDHEDPMKRLINDHEDVSEQLFVLEKVLGLLIDEEAWIRIKPIEDFFKTHLIGHFQFEEKAIFIPLLTHLNTPDVIKLILELQKEHGSILHELIEFQKIIDKNALPLDKYNHTRLNVIGRDIISNLIAHGSKEDDLLVPILKENINIFAKHGQYKGTY